MVKKVLKNPQNKVELLNMSKIPREIYVKKYGPTVGDRVIKSVEKSIKNRIFNIIQYI